MELRHLRYFVAVVEEGHFGRAASRLGISQPPLSRQIRELEEELGAVLLERGRRGAALTPAGEVFYRGCRELLADVAQLVERAARVARGQDGSLSVGYSQSGAWLLIDALSRFRAEHPAIELTLHEMRAAEQAVALRRDDVDVTIGYRLPSLADDQLSALLLVDDPVYLAVPRSLCTGRGFAADQLSRLPLLFMPKAVAPTFHAAVLRALANLGITPSAVRGLASVRNVLTLIGCGVGFGVIPESIAASGARGVELLDHPPLPLSLGTYVFWRRELPATRRFVDCLRAVVDAHTDALINAP